MHYENDEANRWKGFVAGMVGSLAGLVAMRLYWQHVAPLLTDGSSDGNSNESSPLDNISLVGKYHREEESSTEALGRLMYETVTGSTPLSSETTNTLSYLVHWGYGIIQGGLYGATRSKANGLDLKGGLLYATGLWLLGDELAVPALGLQGGPTQASPMQHANRLGAHLAYGLGTATATQLLRRIL